jgi:glycosyltransferase involved in cell wall biosynthesis
MDVCHFTNNVAPLWSPCPLVVTIHDMTLWLLPDHHYRRRLLATRPLIPSAARRAAAIVTVSESAKRDIVRILGLPAEKVHVVYEAPADCFRPLGQPLARATLAGRYSLPERFVLHVGTLEPRKNLVRLLHAFARLRHGNGRPAIPHHLLFVGPRGWKDDAIFATIEDLQLVGAVHLLSDVPTADLVALYNLADALAFPSLYEGFGLPVVEAMASGTPVITSRNGSLAEVANDAAEFIEPTSVESIADGLERVLCHAGRRAELSDLGQRNAARFSWPAAAEQTRQVYADVAAAATRRRVHRDNST